MTGKSSMLELVNLHAFYGKSHVLQGVSLAVGAGEIVALLGRNGAGRSTTARAIMGLVDARGSLLWHGQEILGKKTYQIARLGLGYVPESRDVFPTLTVRQNLMLGQQPGRQSGRWPSAAVYQLFAPLKPLENTPAGVLSGGERQMLALGRALMGEPELIIIDEPTEGLAPQGVAQVCRLLQTLRAQGVSVLLIEQKLTIALDISDRCIVMGHGSVVFDGTPAALCHNSAIRKEWLEV
ncbi:high-affinity branched-chain amino acid transport ATP-binding protein LivF [mine drainage metagenome]|uniref:High-affinity branched-chain amino acid transport ATP-binding protein LivF n=1 Tax=mine drainage metagenome TaxID=410659 RepID=A0A1J5PV41_9ZZZZ